MLMCFNRVKSKLLIKPDFRFKNPWKWLYISGFSYAMFSRRCKGEAATDGGSPCSAENWIIVFFSIFYFIWRTYFYYLLFTVCSVVSYIASSEHLVISSLVNDLFIELLSEMCQFLSSQIIWLGYFREKRKQWRKHFRKYFQYFSFFNSVVFGFFCIAGLTPLRHARLF